MGTIAILCEGNLRKCLFDNCRQMMVTEMNEIDKLRTQIQDVHVPLEVFE